jgi:nitrate/TMAO reductase-like tetraheme cytochrome c subunit
MHAYASDDPVFVAMNARFQRETAGSHPAFCVQCHAPMALRTGATSDGTNLGSLPQNLHGVTCVFCHSVDAVSGTHDDPLVLAGDGAMRGAIADPRPAPHGSLYSSIHDATRAGAASLCGSCHDVQTPSGVDMETTFVEWQSGVYSSDGPGTLLTCAGCHMPARQATATDAAGAPIRTVHDHTFAAVDTASTPFSDVAAQQALVEMNLGSAIVARLCVSAPAPAAASGVQSADLVVTLTLDNAFVGHAWPSGASQDRRAWVELVASCGGQPVYQTGVVQDGQDVTQISDPDLWLLREELFDAQSKEVRMMWQAASTKVAALPVAVTLDPTDPRYDRSVSKTFDVPSSSDQITVRVRMTPIGLDVVDDLVASADLDPSYRANVPVYTMGGTTLTWTQAVNGFGCIP